MSANERETQENTMHTRLVAYLLDELPPSDRAEVEEALAGSTELRAERERLRATIELVQKSLAPMEENMGAETLSSELAAEIQDREARSIVRPWYARSSFRAAASIAAVALGFAVWRASEQTAERSEGRVAENSLSRLEKNEMASATEVAKLEKGYMRGQGLASSSREGDAKLNLPGSDAVGNRQEPKAPSSSPSADAGEVLVRLRSIGYAEEPAVAGGKPSESYLGPVDTVPPQPVVRELLGGSPVEQSQVASSPSSPSPRDEVSGGPSAFARPRPIGSDQRQDAPELLQELGYLGEEESAPHSTLREALTGLGYLDDGDSKEKKDSAALERPGSYEQYRFTHDRSDGDEGARGNDDGGSSRDVFKRHVELEHVFEECLRRRGERPRDMFLRFWGDNPFVLSHQDPLATLSVDVDTASYALARNYLRNGHLPPRAAVRTEEFLNYFQPDVPAPSEETFAIHTDLAPSLFGPSSDHWMLRVVVRGREMASSERSPLALTFVMDTSGSMKEQNRLELVKHGLRLLLSELDARDQIAIVAFSSEARLILPMTSAADRGVIEAALYGLRADGSTNAEAGLRLGYELAAARLADSESEGEVQHRVVLLSDGVANVGQTDQDRIAQDVSRQRERGIYLNTIGVGMNNHNDVFLEQLANKGDGLCNYIDTPLEARRALVDNFTGAFQTIARDVKLQVEFDPSQVRSWRQLGYENRFVADADFRNDTIDAGEVGAGHQVVALFEIERRSGSEEQPIATVRIRWKEPRSGGNGDSEGGAGAAAEMDKRVFAREALGDFRSAPAGFRRALLVAQFAEVLRSSVHAREDSLALLLERSFELEREAKDPDFTELVELIRATRDHLRSHCERDDWSRAVDSYRFNAWRRAECEDEGRAGEELDRLQRERDELELRLRELCEQR